MDVQHWKGKGRNYKREKGRNRGRKTENLNMKKKGYNSHKTCLREYFKQLNLSRDEGNS